MFVGDSETLPAIQKPRSNRAENPKVIRRWRLPDTAKVNPNSPTPEIATGARTMGTTPQPLTAMSVAVDSTGWVGFVPPGVAVIDSPW